MNTQVVPLDEACFEPLYQVVDAVAREKRYLALTEAPPREDAFAFFRGLLESDSPSFVALVDGQLVGWCDVQLAFGQARQHIGLLGIGLLPRARRIGLGTRLMQAAIAKAWARGLTRIELTVRADNDVARALYERLGFEHEGLKRRSFRVDGVYHDSHAMALLQKTEAV